MRLVHLQGLINLRELWLNGTQNTVEGTEKLRECLPNCAIRHELLRLGERSSQKAMRREIEKVEAIFREPN